MFSKLQRQLQKIPYILGLKKTKFKKQVIVKNDRRPYYKD